MIFTLAKQLNLNLQKREQRNAIILYTNYVEVRA